MRAGSIAAAFLGTALFCSVIALPLGTRQAKAAVNRTRVAPPPASGFALVQPPSKRELEERLVVALEDRRELDLAATLVEEPAAAPVPKLVNVAPTAPASALPALDEDALKRDVVARAQEIPMCRAQPGPDGAGLAEVTFLGAGLVAVRIKGPMANTPRGACVARRFISLARSFDGPPVTLRVPFEL